MSSLHDFFRRDFDRVLSLDRVMPCTGPTETVAVEARVLYDFDANAKYMAFFIPDCGEPGKVCASLLMCIFRS